MKAMHARTTGREYPSSCSPISNVGAPSFSCFSFQMLIQVQFIKRELLIATTAIGQLARENELNLRMMATVPAFLLAWVSYRTGDASANRVIALLLSVVAA